MNHLKKGTLHTDKFELNYSFNDLENAPVLLLLHGFLGSHELWSSYVDCFQDSYQVLCVNLPGHGESKALQSDFTIQELAIDISKIPEFYQKKIHIVGHSLGGYIALELALQENFVCESIVLLNSKMSTDTLSKKEERNRVCKVMEKNYGNYCRIVIPNMFQSNFKSWIQLCLEISLQADSFSMISFTKAMRDRRNLTHLIKEADLPVLYIGGELDQAMPIEQLTDEANTNKKATIHIIENSGHMSFLEYPEDVQAHINQFLRFYS